MPRRDAKDGGHTAFTDHLIQRRPESLLDPPADADIAPWRETSAGLQKRNLGIAYIDVGMQRHSSPFVIKGYRTLAEIQRQFTNDGDFFKWIGEALLLGKQTSDAKIAFEHALQLDPNSALTEASAASPYIQEGDLDRAIAHLERAVTLDPLNLPAASTLIGLYQKQGQIAEAAQLSSRISAAMNLESNSDQTAQKDAIRDGQKSTEDAFKNIQVLKGVPSGQLIPAMQFISKSLGVECSFCHVEGQFEKDDKKPKQTARNMMQMMFALNKNNFEGQREVTCYSCHRGARNPIATPVVAPQTQPSSVAANSETKKFPGNLPTASHLIDNYIQALGGATAIESVASRVEKRSINFRGQSVRVELFSLAPSKQSLIRHLPEGDSITIFDSHSGWLIVPGRPASEMQAADLEAARMNADLHFPLHIQDTFPELRVEYPEKIGNREFYVLFATREGQPPTKFYFDEQSSLLVRMVRYSDSPLGRSPTQIDYADYRDVDSVQVPFRITYSQPGSTSTMQMDLVQQNVPIDDARFVKPPSDRPRTDSPDR
jgi:tetratricopeptide (TPR) repeat protein